MRPLLRREEVEFFLRLHGLWESMVRLPRPPPPPFDIESLQRIEPPSAIKEWIAGAPLWPCRLQDPPPDLVLMMRRLAAAEAFPTTNLTSTSSTVPGIHPIPIQTGSTKRPKWQAPEIHLDDGTILVLEYT